jgi:F-type H+-transporting ATPase subunit b
VIPDITALWVIALLLLCTVLLNTLIFQPILRVMEQRGRAVADARALAQTAAERAATASTEYSQKLNEARSDVYRQMDETRRAAMDTRASLLAETRARAERELNDATARVEQQTTEARASLDRDADSLAAAIVTRVLGRAS